jgi:hypothetical protein
MASWLINKNLSFMFTMRGWVGRRTAQVFAELIEGVILLVMRREIKR